MYKVNGNFISSPTSGAIDTTLSSNIIGHWKGTTQTISGNSMLDSGAHENDLTSTTSISSTFLTTGIANYLDITTPDIFLASDLITSFQWGMEDQSTLLMSLRIQRDTIPSTTAGMVSITDTSSSPSVTLHISALGYPITRVVNGADGTLSQLAGSTNICDGAEHHLMILVKFTTLAYSGYMYLDGKLIDTVVDQAMTVNPSATDTKIYVGSLLNDGSPFGVGPTPTVNKLWDVQVGARSGLGTRFHNIANYAYLNPLQTIPAELF